jgi:hypothetical protein
MRDSLNAAFDAVDEDYEETEQTVESADEPVTEVDEPVTASNDDTPVENVGTEAKEPVEKVETEAKEPVETASEGTRSIKAPIDWSPKEREDWSRIPPHLQTKIKEREQATQDLMQETASARKTHKDFSALAQQYGSVLSGVAGNTPMEAVGNLFDTVANLRMGSEVQKAQTIANLIETFGVDIGALDSQLSGQMPAQPDQNAEMNRMFDERMAPMTQYMQQMQRQERQSAQNMQNTALNEVKSFADSGNAEFLNDVRMDMADLIDMSAKRGQSMTMEQAYQKACAIHPQISGVLSQRAAQDKLTGGNNNMAAKREAASSITGSRIGVNAGNGSLSLRDQISSAWDAQGE